MDLLIKKVLTLIDCSEVKTFPQITSEILCINLKDVRKIVNRLIKEKFVNVIKLGNKSIYSHTSKVKVEMIDEDLHYKYGSRPLSTYIK
ncbi:hypothetical protein J4423_00900 [Candidatus Pacearchaeota archaeon]|nr:hypothetical protein [Candidatus Pacearchaeota archaeon]